MEDKRMIVLRTILFDMENHWKHYEKTRQENIVRELSLPVQAEKWNLLFRLVRVKKGSMNEEGIADYLRDFFGIHNLQLVSRKEVEKAIQFLSKLQDKEPT